MLAPNGPASCGDQCLLIGAKQIADIVKVLEDWETASRGGNQGVTMSKFTLVLIAAVIAVAGASTAQAQSKTGKGKDQATCSRLIKANPAYQGRDGCNRACAAAIRACMQGQPY
jgi:hypothetical protein